MEQDIELKVDNTRKNNIIFKFRGEGLKLSAERGYKSQLTEYATGSKFDYGLKTIDNLMQFIEYNRRMKGGFDAIQILESSINLFFWFEDGMTGKTITSSQLSDDFKEEYWNYDAPDLYVGYILNKGKAIKKASEIFHYTRLLETYWSKAYITGVFDEYKQQIISNLKQLIAGYEGTIIHKEIEAYISSSQYNEKELADIKNEIKSYENRLQNIIDNNRERILDSVDEYRDKTADEVLNMVGLDSGFVNIYSKRSDIQKKLRILSNHGETKWLHLSFPFSSQSTTVQKKQAMRLNEILEEKDMIPLQIEVNLD